MDLPWTLAELQERARELLPPDSYGYFCGGAGDELTLRDNEQAWRDLGLRQRVLVDVAVRDLRTRFLGSERAHPLVVAPMAYQGVAHPGGEAELARGAAAAGAPYVLSTFATTTITGLAREVPQAERWYQLYVFRDRALTERLVAEAVANGYTALVVTADVPVLGLRDRDVRSGFTPGRAERVPMVRAAGGAGELTPAQAAQLLDPALTWADIEAFGRGAGLPVVVKGLLEPDDARRARDAGAAAVVVSNHGGRQLDTVAATARALPGVVAAVGSDLDVFVDGGIRRGTDVVKALALGARGVLVGRPALWGLAAGGAAGAQRALEILLRELDLALALTGVPRASGLTPAVLR